VQLEVLDWGGVGRPIVLLAGLGNTAHVLDDFAQKLRADGRVYGITRRGYGASSVPADGYDGDRLGEDVVIVLNALRLDRPVLIGHSVAGQELSLIGTRYPERVAGLVYLDAYHHAYETGLTAEQYADLDARAPTPRPPGPDDQRSMSALLSYYEHGRGYRPPEAELRQSRGVGPDGGVGPIRTPPWVPDAIVAGARRYVDVRPPALAVYAVPPNPGAWIRNDSSRVPAVEAYIRDLTTAINLEAAAFESGTKGRARIVRVPDAHHYVFISHEADVLRELRSFLQSLP